jgi:hypothetical protein
MILKMVYANPQLQMISHHILDVRISRKEDAIILVATERCLESLAAVVTVYAGIKRNT